MDTTRASARHKARLLWGERAAVSILKCPLTGYWTGIAHNAKPAAYRDSIKVRSKLKLDTLRMLNAALHGMVVSELGEIARMVARESA